MSGRTSKLIRKWCRKHDLNYRGMKKAYITLTTRKKTDWRFQIKDV